VTRGRRGLTLAIASFLFATPLSGQVGPPTEQYELPRWGENSFDGRYPVRVLTLETARVLDRWDGTVGLGDTRLALFDRRVEILTQTIGDIVGIANVGVKVELVDPESHPIGFAVGARVYQSYSGLMDEGVKWIAESFSEITDAETEVSGVLGFATATWLSADDATGHHLGLQVHRPNEYQFDVADTVKGGSGILKFDEGHDVSLMWGVDHRLVGTSLLALGEAGWSFGLERARLGLGVDAGSQHWRVTAGVTYPGVETDLATEARDFYVNPILSFHYRF
jgi:hypothetical protein